MGLPTVVAITSGGSSAEQTETVPVVSVRPYAVTTDGTPSSSRMRRISSTGTTAAPVTDVRTDERS